MGCDFGLRDRVCCCGVGFVIFGVTLGFCVLDGVGVIGIWCLIGVVWVWGWIGWWWIVGLVLFFGWWF